METKTYKLKDICEIKSGKRLPLGCDFSAEPTAYPYIRARDIKKGKVYSDDLAYITKDVQSKIKNYIVDENDILITIVANIGDVGLVTRDLQGFNLTENAVRLTNFAGNVDSRFLCLYMSQPDFKKYLEGLAVGAAQAKLGIYKIEKIKIQLPPLPTQRRIASILSTYDALIQNYKRQIAALQSAASELYKEWFVRFRFPGYKNAKFDNGLPEGWKVEKLGELANISTGKCNREDAEENGIYPLFDRSQEIKKSNEWIKDCEAIIVPGEGTEFMPRYYKGKFNLHQRCYCVEPKIENFGKFLFYVLMLNRKYFLSVATGATVPSLRYNNFAFMKFVLPNIQLCNKFNYIADGIFTKIDNLNLQITNLTTQRDLLLPRLMSGKLSVE